MSWTPSVLIPLLRARGIRPRRSLGQNFLLDANFLDLIVREAAPGKGGGVVEIGTGPGNLTDRLAAAAGRVWSFDVDAALHQLASELLASRPNVTLVRADGASFEKLVDWSECPSWVAVSNLPYSVWQELLIALLSAAKRFDRYVLMIQRDAFERLSSPPGTRGYGPLGVIVQGCFTLRKIRHAAPSMFHPRPAVDSTLFELRPRVAPPGDLRTLERALRRLFAQRRKKLSTAWKRAAGSAIADDVRVDQAAPERLLELAAALG